MAFAATERNRGAAVNGNVFIRMPPTRRIAFAAGVLFIITFVTSIPALYLYQPVLDNPAGYIAGAGANNRIFLGASLELLLIIAVILSYGSVSGFLRAWRLPEGLVRILPLLMFGIGLLAKARILRWLASRRTAVVDGTRESNAGVSQG